MRLLRVLAVMSLAAGSVAVAGPARAAGCLDPSVPLSVEENRLTVTLPGQDRPFARQMIEGAGFQGFTPALVRRLCAARSPGAAEKLLAREGEKLWHAAVDRAQRRGPVRGSLPYSDDRPLYWTRIEATAAIRRLPLFSGQRLQLIEKFDRASRGMSDIDLPAGSKVKRIIVSGFDPYTLDGGMGGNNIRHGNPSGATALSLDGTRHGNAFIEAYTLPVSYPEFRRGYLEDTVGPFMRPGPRQVDASITVSQAGGAVFNLEQFNARYHGVSPGNDNFRPCAAVGGLPQLAVNNPECNITVVDRWGGPATPDLRDPPQWTSATLPVEAMIAAGTGADVPRPPGDTWPDEAVAFGVVHRTSYIEFPDCAAPERVTRDGVPPSPQSCSYSGGGGNYLSNESAYRNTLLRDRLGLSIPAGHIHTPDMQHFETDYEPSDSTFDAWRLAIAQQTRNLVHVVADEA
jgi:pyrrolidone-carboxylate peptidase